jgi:hypothetical protein
MTTVTVKGQMNTSAETLWDSLKGFDLNYFRGFPHTVQGSEVGATRTFDMGKGEIAEQIEQYDAANRTLTYTVLYGPLPVQDYHATVKILPGDQNSCELEWSAVFEPKDATEAEAMATMEGTFKTNIKALNKFHGQ